MTPSRLLLEFVLPLSEFHFQISNFRRISLVGALTIFKVSNFYQFNYCIFAFAVGNTAMAE